MKALTKLFITGFSGLLLAMLFYMFLVGPMLAKISELHANAEAKKSELVRLEKQILAYQTAEADLSKADQRQKISDSFVSREDLVIAIEGVERAARLTRTEESKIITDEVENPPKKGKKQPDIINGKKLIEEVPYQLSIRNDYLGVVNFLRYLEHLPQLSEVTKITLSAETLNSSAGVEPVHTGLVLGTIEAIFFVKTYETE